MQMLKINGEEKSFEDDRMPATVSDLLAELDIKHIAVIAEIDGRIIDRDNFATTELKNGQQIELIRFIGGG